jgi:peptidoglycan/xylan/chitin deacetylase (PgdA/CDA1 family)
MNVKLATKKMLGYFVNAFSLIEIISRNRPKSIVLGYHRILPETSNQLSFCLPGMYVTSDTFKRHISFMRKHYKIVHLYDLITAPSADMRCAITFDDGWLDNYLFALPILREHNVPATIFISTGFVNDQEWPWPDRIMYYVRTAGEAGIINIINVCYNNLGLNSVKPCHSMLDAITEIKRLPHSDIIRLMTQVDSYFSELYKELKKTSPALSWENILEMSDYGIDFGLHSHGHIIANEATPTSQIEQDYFTSAEIFASKFGKPPTLFAYPNGNYNNDVIQILSKMNINFSVTTEAGCFSDNNPMAIKRILLHNDVSSTEELLAYKLITSAYFGG